MVAIVVASTRVGRFADVIVDWFIAQAEQHSRAEIDVVDLPSFELPYRFPSRGTPATEALSARLSDADAFVIIVPAEPLRRVSRIPDPDRPSVVAPR